MATDTLRYMRIPLANGDVGVPRTARWKVKAASNPHPIRRACRSLTSAASATLT